uniref:Uncharacterized protein n=1 Tax=Magallana gigas TaxID=29159 RepID=A0A8W8JUR1_MAGGI
MADSLEKTPALRVSQLDASELDSEVVHIVKAQLNKLFKYHKSNILVTYDPEVSALIKTLIWRLTYMITIWESVAVDCTLSSSEVYRYFC